MQYILIAPWIPLLAALVLLLGGLSGLRGSGRSLAVLAVLTGLGCLLAGNVLPGPATGEGTAGLTGWHGLIERLSATFFPGRLSMMWLLATSWTALLLFLSPVSREEEESSLRRESIAGLLLLALTQLVVLSTNADVQWTLMVMSGWAVAWSVQRREFSVFSVQFSESGSKLFPEHRELKTENSLRPTLLTLAVADLLWLLALLPLEQAFGTLEISRITRTVSAVDLEPETFQFGLLVTAGFWLLCSLMIRCGLFPVMGWVSETVVGVSTDDGAAESKSVPMRNVGWVMGFTLAQGVFLLLQWQPVVAVSGEQQALIVGLSGLSALLLGVMALGRPPHLASSGNGVDAHKLVRVAGLMIALIWLGAIAFPAGTAWMAGFSLAVILLIPLTALLLPTDFGGGTGGTGGTKATKATEETKGREGIFWLTIAVLLLGSGVLGQERVFDAVWSGVRSSEGRLPAAMLGVVLLGHGLGSFVLFRILFRARDRLNAPEEGEATAAAEQGSGGAKGKGFLPPSPLSPRPPVPSSSPPPSSPKGSWRVALLSALTLLLGGLTVLSPVWLMPGSGLPMPAIGGTAIVGAIALVAAWAWPRSALPLSGLDSVQRLADREFYSQTFIQSVIVMPVRGLAQVARLIEWLVIEPVVMRGSRSLFQQLHEVATVMDEETPPSRAAVTLGLAAGVMLIGLILSRWM
jgi:hypothetical protein